ncbi:MAG: AAA family ATPase, partial [Candidatus Margulisiibacteriota bacterium]
MTTRAEMTNAGLTRSIFSRRFLPRPTITPELRDKAMGAYQHTTEVMNYPVRDMHFGAETLSLGALSHTNYREFEEEYNSVVIATILNSLLCGSMLYQGQPGSGKTTTPEIVGQILFGLTLKEIEDATIYCHPNLTEEKMTGSFHIPRLMQGEKQVIWGHWVESFYRMLDEANRQAPETSSILLQAIDRRRVSYAGENKDMPFGPIAATANFHDEGNFPMTPPFLDRFGISVYTTGINPAFLGDVFANFIAGYVTKLNFAEVGVDTAELLKALHEAGYLIGELDGTGHIKDYAEVIKVPQKAKELKLGISLTADQTKMVMGILQKVWQESRAADEQSASFDESLLAHEDNDVFADEIDRKSYALTPAERLRVFAEIQSIGIRAESLNFLSYLVSGLTSCYGHKGLEYYQHSKALLPDDFSIKDYCSKALCNFTRTVCSQIRERQLGRGILAVRDYGRALAWLMGRKFMDNEILSWAFRMAMGHRLTPSDLAMNGNESPLGTDIDKKLFASRTWKFAQ